MTGRPTIDKAALNLVVNAYAAQAPFLAGDGGGLARHPSDDNLVDYARQQVLRHLPLDGKMNRRRLSHGVTAVFRADKQAPTMSWARAGTSLRSSALAHCPPAACLGTGAMCTSGPGRRRAQWPDRIASGAVAIGSGAANRQASWRAACRRPARARG
jgi:hypothetical protein